MEAYEVSFEHLSGKKNIMVDALSYLDNHELTILHKEALTLPLGSEVSNIKFPMYTALVFIEQIKVSGLRNKGLSQSYYNMQHIEG
jgi:hypothetical protein